MADNTFYDDQLLQLIFEQIRAFRLTLSLRDRFKEPSISSKFDLLLLSIPREIREKIQNKMELELIKLQFDKEAYDRKNKYKSGFTGKDRDLQFYNYEYNTYAPFLAIVIDELDMVFRRKEDSKTLDPSRKFCWLKCLKRKNIIKNIIKKIKHN